MTDAQKVKTVGIAFLGLMAAVGKGCTVPTSVDYKCEGGRKVAIETQHEVAVFGVPFIATRQRGEIVGECHDERELDKTP